MKGPSKQELRPLFNRKMRLGIENNCYTGATALRQLLPFVAFSSYMNDANGTREPPRAHPRAETTSETEFTENSNSLPPEGRGKEGKAGEECSWQHCHRGRTPSCESEFPS
ncbi:Hypothetical protein NTJ_12181 [Nesidiocoris tenuis]|uniref:Uncharacterized protein n=1 Tax=Nesidiocoris tenuis TaxID=355587 RepID=A0ABN7B679_9HEMI|nr:Hypothetical protein NTJ_12181 [Nesidiocoris tenuis]